MRGEYVRTPLLVDLLVAPGHHPPAQQLLREGVYGARRRRGAPFTAPVCRAHRDTPALMQGTWGVLCCSTYLRFFRFASLLSASVHPSPSRAERLMQSPESLLLTNVFGLSAASAAALCGCRSSEAVHAVWERACGSASGLAVASSLRRHASSVGCRPRC
jgi:hypothetical protein